MSNSTPKIISHQLDQIDLDPVSRAEVNKFLRITPSSLAKGIQICHRDVQSVKVKIMAAIKSALPSACAAGFQLLAAKETIPWGEFGSFVSKSGISDDTAARYMCLAANFAHVRKMKPGTTLRMAYILVGLIKPPKPKTLEQILPAKVRNLRKEIMAAKSTTLGSASRCRLTSQLRSLENTCTSLRLKLNADAQATKLSTKNHLRAMRGKRMAELEFDPSNVLPLFLR